MNFPDIDPIALQLGPLAIRWYGLAYLAGLVIGWRYTMAYAQRLSTGVTARDMDDFLIWAVLGVVIGGRLGQVLFYQPGYYFSNPIEILKIWQGGMAFHGGLLGVIAAIAIYTRRRGLPFFAFTDLIALVAPIGICFGRIANFINQEHWGRPTDAAVGMVFPRDPDQVPRHPSQLYEAALEGLALYLLVAIAAHGLGQMKRPGMVTGLFLIGYGLARGVSEFFRDPEVLVGALPFATTWGQWLTLPMILAGAYVIVLAARRPAR
ncbi:MAG: prolipoprotein diacylglyceryl transferase [Alphaproteobacteria bacterium]|nr:prolipoprotein diacylglyceryl transferase [Alphaproteobacteria bacterium]